MSDYFWNLGPNGFERLYFQEEPAPEQQYEKPPNPGDYPPWQQMVKFL